MRTEIDLKFNRKDFEEIFFLDHQGDYFRSPTTKTSFQYLLIALSLLIVSGVLYYFEAGYAWLVFGVIIFVTSLFQYLKVVNILRKWKREIKEYLDKNEKHLTHKLVLSDKYFSIIQDGNENLEDWGNFSSVRVSDNYISLEGKTNYFIPLKTMGPEKYKEVRKIISEKLHSLSIPAE